LVSAHRCTALQLQKGHRKVGKTHKFSFFLQLFTHFCGFLPIIPLLSFYRFVLALPIFTAMHFDFYVFAAVEAIQAIFTWAKVTQ